MPQVAVRRDLCSFGRRKTQVSEYGDLWHRPSTRHALVLTLAIALLTGFTRAQAVRVELRQDGDAWRMTRGGEPYFIRGGGGTGSPALLAQLNGNSIRTWGTEGLDKTLAEADRHHLTVTAGIWLEPPRHGMNYADPRQLDRQEAMVRKAISRFKDQPALLMWGLGNEVESAGAEDNEAVYKAIDRYAVIAHELDPNHPTLAVVAEITAKKIAHLNALCPHVDVIGVNAYGNVASVPQRYRKWGGTRPFILSEYGPPGGWESKKTSYGSPIELTSTQKAERYLDGYRHGVLGDPKLCVGSYAFIWGSKQEITATWFGTFLADGARLGAVDALGEAWSGKPPEHACPQVRSLKLKTPDKAKAGGTLSATLEATGATRVRWVVQAEQSNVRLGGDREAIPTTFPSAVVRGDLTAAEIQAPAASGAYRLFAYLYDDAGGAAVANVPFLVEK